MLLCRTQTRLPHPLPFSHWISEAAGKAVNDKAAQKWVSQCSDDSRAWGWHSLWYSRDSTGWQEACYRHGITSFETLLRNFSYLKVVGAEGPSDLVLNIFGYLPLSRWDTDYQYAKYIHRELSSHQDFMYVPFFFHPEIFPEQKKCVTCKLPMDLTSAQT